MEVFKEQIETLIIYWKRKLKKSKTYEETEEIKENIRRLRIFKEDIELRELEENYIPRMEI